MNTPATILAVDDQASFRFVLQQQISDAGFTAILSSSAEDALSILERRKIDLILSDLIMPGIDGLSFLRQVRERFSTVPFILITAQGTVASAVESLKLGAFDYIEKHCSRDELQMTIQRALAYQNLVNENKQFKQQLQQEHSFQSVVTVNRVMKQALDMAASVVGSPRTTVALFGESGSGKEVLARAIHFAGGGMPANFVGVNCAAIPDALLESELFGHTRGAFTGADREREGKFSLAKGGTILLDEIGDMPLPLQAKLLRVLEERVFESVGSNKQHEVTCRVIVASNQNLLQFVADGKFREDLYHRINIFPIYIPPLRERTEDIPMLADHFMRMLRNQLGKQLPGVSNSAMEILLSYRWAGNVRELRNCLERAAILAPDGELIRPEHLSIFTPVTPLVVDTSPVASATGMIQYQLNFLPDEISLEAVTDQVLAITLERFGGNKSKAAALLKVNRKMFYR